VRDETLTLDEVRQMFLDVCRRIKETKDELTDADRAIGDGDHGVGMARGFEAVRQKLESGTFETVSELLRTIGRTLLSSMGGASGVLFATFFTGGASQLDELKRFDADALRRLLADGTAAVAKRGGASPGDKTMLDALAPAAQTLAEMPSAPLPELFRAASEGARRGAEQTKQMVARTGKARALGERSLGHADPGALSISVILQAMAEYVSA
jgi:phosphoenolpyruvate---glycerone phosphotransferase subunit DhaL